MVTDRGGGLYAQTRNARGGRTLGRHPPVRQTANLLTGLAGIVHV